MTRRNYLLLAAAALVGVSLFGPGAALPALALDQVVLRINFTPWGMHAPLFGGREQGFYKAEGIDLEIRPASEGQQNEIFIGTGREQFGLSNADSFVKARANGVPVVAIMGDQPDTPNAIITLKKNGIEKPAQLKGKKMAWFQKNAVGLLDPVLESGGLKQSDITLLPVARGAEVQMLAAGQVDALFGYAYGQGMTLSARGFPVNIMRLSDYGVRVYGTLFYTSDALLKSNPDLVKRFVRATLKSIDWTRNNMEKAVASVIKVSPDRELKLETQKLEIIYGIYRSPDYAQRFGAMTDEKWQSSVDVMAPDLPRKPAPKELYTNAILDSLDEAKEVAAHLRTPTN